MSNYEQQVQILIQLLSESSNARHVLDAATTLSNAIAEYQVVKTDLNLTEITNVLTELKNIKNQVKEIESYYRPQGFIIRKDSKINDLINNIQQNTNDLNSRNELIEELLRTSKNTSNQTNSIESKLLAIESRLGNIENLLGNVK